MAGIARAVSEAARNLPDGRGLRILEVGAGTGGLAACVMPMLERGRHTYVFSDISPAFFSTAAQKLAAFPEVDFKSYDLDKPAAAQGFEAGAFDIILGTNVLHAVADVRATLRQLHDLLAPDGTLLFTDLATPQLWTESTFGLTSGWWRFTDRDLRPEQPLLAREQWEPVLRECGFHEVMSLRDSVDRLERARSDSSRARPGSPPQPWRKSPVPRLRRSRGSSWRTPPTSATSWPRASKPPACNASSSDPRKTGAPFFRPARRSASCGFVRSTNRRTTCSSAPTPCFNSCRRSTLHAPPPSSASISSPEARRPLVQIPSPSLKPRSSGSSASCSASIRIFPAGC